MIDRRRFAAGLALGLGSMLLPGMAGAEVRANGRVLPERKRRLADIPYTPLDQIPNHRQFMRDIVIALSAYARKRKPDFAILVRNAPELLIKEKREWDWQSGRDPDGAAAGKYTPLGSVDRPYLRAIDGMLMDGLFYGRDKTDQPTPDEESRPLLEAAKALGQEGRRSLSIEYCHSASAQAAAARKTAAAKVLTYLDRDGDRLLGRIPHGHPAHENAEHVTDLAGARNFLPLLRSQAFGSRDDWVKALEATNYDLLLLDTFWRGSDSMTLDEMKRLKFKNLGSRRLVMGVLPLGRATDTRFYWKPDWTVGNPKWLVAPAPADPSRTIVQYWAPEWKEILGKYMQGLVDLGCDGVVFDAVDSYLYFEDLMPLD